MENAHPSAAAAEGHINLCFPPALAAILEWHGLTTEDTGAQLPTEWTPVSVAGAFQSAGLVPRVTARKRFRRKSNVLAFRPGRFRSDSPLGSCPVIGFGKNGSIIAFLPCSQAPSGWKMVDTQGRTTSVGSFRAWRAMLRKIHRRVMAVYPSTALHTEAGFREIEPDNSPHWIAKSLWNARVDLLHIVPASLLINGFALSLSLFIMAVYDRVVPNNAIETLWVLATGVAVVFAFEFVIRLLRGAFVDYSGKTIDTALADKVFGHTLALDMRARPASAGSFSSQARAYETVREFLSSATMIGFVDFPFALLMFGVVFWLGGPVGWIPVFTSSTALMVVLLTQPFLRNLSGKSYAQMIGRHSLFSEAANGLESVKAANAAQPLAGRMREAVMESARIDLKSKKISHFGSSFTALCVNLTTVGVIVASVFQVAKGNMTMGAMIACVMIVGRGMAPLAQISNLLLRLQATISSVKGLNKIMALPREDAGAKLRRQVRFPTLVFKDVGFSYAGQPIPSLQEINLTIRPGDSIGLIGRAGSGKTTLLRLISRQLVPDHGLITIDGVDASQLHPQDVRHSIGYLPQDGTIFFGTVKDNILLGERLDSSARFGNDDSKLLEAAERSGVLEWTNRHPMGLNLPVGERGVMLSGGQRQSILLARTLLNNPDMLLLDEPTASLDLTAEKRFLDTVRIWLDADRKRTLVLSTHRLTLLKLVDYVILLDQGKIKVAGKRQDVIALLTKSNRAENGVSPQDATVDSIEL